MPIPNPPRGLLCFLMVSLNLASASIHSGSVPPIPIFPGRFMLMRASSDPSHTISTSGHSVRIASRLLIPSRVSIWIMTAAWLFTDL
ncbi:hypothetical protein BJ170DRAFT_296234 [Xylariales sp. AK1849]|nr:hypothetical protein BJ170DRAFT_296234 [Xylariales sp. AK1849]